LKNTFLILVLLTVAFNVKAQDLSYFKDSTTVVFYKRAVLKAPQKLTPHITVKKVMKNRIVLKDRQPKPVYFDVTPELVNLNDVALPIKIKGTFTQKRLKFAKTIEAPPLLFRDNSKRNIKYLDKAHGSFSNHITQITQDSLGIIWMGSTDAGLAKYNGRTFKIIDKSVGLAANTVENIFLDAANRLWISSSYGLHYIKNNTLFTLKGAFKNYEFRTIYEDRRHNIWVSTFNNGCLKYDGKQWLVYNEKSGLTKGGISGIYQDKNDNYWFGSWTNKGLTRFDGKKFYHYKPENHKLGIDFHAFAEYEGKLWMGTYAGGIVVYDKGKFYRYDFFKEQDGNVYSFALNKYGLWFNIYGLGVGNYHRGKFYFYFKEDGLRDRQSYKIFSDTDDNIWVADLFYGFSRIDNDLFYKETFNNKFRSNQIAFIGKDPEGNTWFTPNGGLITKIRNNTLTTYVNNSDYNTPSIHHSYGGYFLGKDKAWLSTIAEGVVYFNKNTFTFYNFGKRNAFGRIIKDSSARFWFASNFSGLVFKSPKGFYEFGKNQGLSANTVNDLAYVGDSAVWATVKNKGINVIKEDKIFYTDKNNGLISNQILALYVDRKKRIWLASENKGVQMIDGQTSYSFNESNGLLSNKTESLVESEPNVFWVTSNRGLTKIAFLEDKTLKINTFNNNYGNNLIGLPGAVFSQGNGEVFWGASKGLLVYNSRFKDKVNKAPILSLESLRINKDEKLKAFKKGDIITFYHNDDFKIIVNAINWGFESTLKYKYRIVGGLDNKSNWKLMPSNGMAVLNHLSLADTEIIIKAVSDAGESKALRIPIKIRPYFYQNIYYHLIFWIVIIGLTVLYFQYKKSLAIEKKRDLELIISQKTAVILKEKEALENSHQKIVTQNKEKDALIQEVHHRVKNNLQLISSMVSMQINSLKSAQSKKILLETYNRIASMALVHEILYTRDNVSYISLKAYLSDLIHNINQMVNFEKIDIQFNKSLEDIQLNVSDCIALGMIANESISNAIKYAFKNMGNPKIDIDLKYNKKSKYITFVILDNGIGIDSEYLKDINKSLGLRLISIFAKQLKARLDIKNKKGTKVSIKFKCRNNEDCNR
jgi:two-component sensor histidine kinase/ligand-binding sensor domain-containing protein